MNRQTKIVLSLILACTGGSLLGNSQLQLSENAQVHFLASAAFVYEENIFLSRQGSEVSGRYFVFSPGVEFRMSEEGALSAVLRYQHHFRFFRDQTELDTDMADIDFQARYSSGRTLVTGYANFRELSSNTADANRVGDLIHRDNLGAGAKIRYELSELTAFSTGLDYNDVDYDDAIYTDYQTVSVPLMFIYKYRPKLEFNGGIRYRTTDTDGIGTFDFEDIYYFVGATGEFFSPLLFADLSIGYQKRDYDDSNIDTASGSYDLTFTYVGDAKTTVYLNLSRDYRTSAVGGTAYAFTSGSLGARYRFTESIGFNASVTIGESEYEESPRAEDMMFINIGASYKPNDYLSLNAGYEYQNVDGKNVVSSDYKNSKFRVSASLRY
jgi:hypothetical protein